ncbi:MAG: PLP-dependent aminotransferase family protein, partial [Rhodobacteraceae bacterium]|nr:PLP-dependent aminotransferase family protein [Paracoccaceae bacterium]
QPDIISFAGGIPDPNLFPAKEFEAAFSAIFSSDERNAALQYSVSEGYEPLREWIASEMGRLSIPCDIDNIMITSGSQQALDYLGKLLLSPEDTALVGWPTYLGALGAFNAYEPNYDRLDVHTNRSAQDYAETAKARGGRVKFAYMSVDFANPTGETLNRAERDRVLDLADDLNCAVIEDAAYQTLRYDGVVIPPILALEIARKGSIEEARTIYCGSFSKTLAPGLRVGWVCAAKPVISRLVLMKQAADLHTPTINQIAITKIATTIFDSHVTKIRATYKARRDRMLQALAEHMPEGVQWTQPQGGMFIWLTLPTDIDGAELLAKALETQKIAFVPGSAFFADGSGKNTLRLSFSLADEATIEEGIRRLGVVLK